MRHRKEIYEREKKRQVENHELSIKSVDKHKDHSHDGRLPYTSQIDPSHVTEPRKIWINDNSQRVSRRDAFEQKIGMHNQRSIMPTYGQTLNRSYSNTVPSVHMADSALENNTSRMRHNKERDNRYEVQEEHRYVYLTGSKRRSVKTRADSISHPIPVIGNQINSLRDDLYLQDQDQMSWAQSLQVDCSYDLTHSAMSSYSPCQSQGTSSWSSDTSYMTNDSSVPLQYTNNQNLSYTDPYLLPDDSYWRHHSSVPWQHQPRNQNHSSVPRQHQHHRQNNYFSVPFQYQSRQQNLSSVSLQHYPHQEGLSSVPCQYQHHQPSQSFVPLQYQHQQNADVDTSKAQSNDTCTLKRPWLSCTSFSTVTKPTPTSPAHVDMYRGDKQAYAFSRPGISPAQERQFDTSDRLHGTSLQCYYNEKTTQNPFGFNTGSVITSTTTLPSNMTSYTPDQGNILSNVQVSVQSDNAVGILTTMHIQNVSRETVSKQIEIIPLVPPPKPPACLLREFSPVVVPPCSEETVDEQTPRVSGVESHRCTDKIANKGQDKVDNSNSVSVSSPNHKNMTINQKTQHESVGSGKYKKALKSVFQKIEIKKPSEFKVNKTSACSQKKKVCEPIKHRDRKRAEKTGSSDKSTVIVKNSNKGRHLLKTTKVPVQRKTHELLHKSKEGKQIKIKDKYPQDNSGKGTKTLKSTGKCFRSQPEETVNKVNNSAMFTTFLKTTDVRAPNFSSKTTVVKEADSSTSDSKHEDRTAQNKSDTIKSKVIHEKVGYEKRYGTDVSNVCDENNNIIDKEKGKNQNDETNSVFKQKKLERQLKVNQKLIQKRKSDAQMDILANKDKESCGKPPSSKQFLNLFAGLNRTGEYVEKLEAKAFRKQKLLTKQSLVLNQVNQTCSSTLTHTANPVINTAAASKLVNKTCRTLKERLINKILMKSEKAKKLRDLSKTNTANKLSSLGMSKKELKSLMKETLLASKLAHTCSNDKNINNPRDIIVSCRNDNNKEPKPGTHPMYGNTVVKECSVVMDNNLQKMKSDDTNMADVTMNKTSNPEPTSTMMDYPCHSYKTTPSDTPFTNHKVKQPHVKRIADNTDSKSRASDAIQDKSSIMIKKPNDGVKATKRKAILSRGKYILSTPTTYKIRSNISNVKKGKKLASANTRFLKACSAAKNLLNDRNKAAKPTLASDTKKKITSCERTGDCEQNLGSRLEKNTNDKRNVYCTLPDLCDTRVPRLSANSTFMESDKSPMSNMPTCAPVTNVPTCESNKHNLSHNQDVLHTYTDKLKYDDVQISLQEPHVATEVPSPFWGHWTDFERELDGERPRGQYSPVLCADTQSMITQSSLKASPEVGQAKFADFFRAVLQRHLRIETFPDNFVDNMRSEIVEMYRKYVQAKATICQKDGRPLQNIVPPVLVSPSWLSQYCTETSPSSSADCTKAGQPHGPDSPIMTTPTLIHTDTGISRVECKKVLNAYEIHRHLEPSCTQPSISEGIHNSTIFSDSRPVARIYRTESDCLSSPVSEDSFIALPLRDSSCMYTSNQKPDCQTITQPYKDAVKTVDTTPLKSPVSTGYKVSEQLTKSSHEERLMYRNVFDDAVADIIQKESPAALSDAGPNVLDSLYDNSDAASDILECISVDDLFRPSCEERKSSISSSPFQARIRSERRKRYQKRFPTSLPKAKSDKMATTEKELYKDADEFLSNFDASQKRKCRPTTFDQNKRFRLNLIEFVKDSISQHKDKQQKLTPDSTVTNQSEHLQNASVPETDADLQHQKNSHVNKPHIPEKSNNTSTSISLKNQHAQMIDDKRAPDTIVPDKLKVSHGPSHKYMKKRLLHDVETKAIVEKDCKPISKTKQLKKHNPPKDQDKIEKKESTDTDLLSSDRAQNISIDNEKIKKANKYLPKKCQKIPLLRIKTEKSGLMVVQREDTKKHTQKENRSGHIKAVAKRLKEASLVAQKHVKMDNKVMPCPVCGKPFVKQFYFKKHFRTEHHNWCQTCIVRFVNMDDRTKHLELGHEVELFCDICQKSFLQKKSYRAHSLTSRHLLKAALTSEPVVASFKQLELGSEAEQKAKTKHIARVIETSVKPEETTQDTEDDTNPGGSSALDKPNAGLHVKREYCEICQRSYVKFSAHLMTLKHKNSVTALKVEKTAKIKKSAQNKARAVTSEKPEMPDNNPVIELTNLQPATDAKSPIACNPVLLIKNIASTLSAMKMTQTGNHSSQTVTSGNQSSTREWICLGDNNDVCVIETLSPDPENIEKLKSMNVDKYLNSQPATSPVDLFCEEQMEDSDHILRPDQVLVVVTSGSELD